jgi:FimV-like protein
MRLVGLLIFSILLQIFSVTATAETTVRLKGPKSTENPDRSRVGPLTPNDTLWRIAEEVRPHPGLNIYQVMYAIYLKNPESFLDDNFNHLNTGSFLAIPNVDEILSVDAVDAQRKSEEDDRIWAERVRAAAAAKVKQGVNTAQQKDVDKAKQEIKKELVRVEVEQKSQLSDLQNKLAESNVTVEAVLADNNALKETLDKLADQMLLMKSQVDKDSEIQQQLQLLVAQQAEMLAQQKAQIERENQGLNFAELWQNLSSSAMTWVVLASLPTLLLLFAVLGWIKRRTRKSEQIINAATAVPQHDAGYRSPLPPLDESLDFDENSLMTLDESLLGGRGKNEIRLDDEPIDLHDDMLLDTRADEFDDILLNDDDLLDSKDLLDASSIDQDLLDDLLDQPGKVEEKEFDPNNILSGADLSALFDEEPDLDDDEDIFAQAVAEQLAAEQKQKTPEPPALQSTEEVEDDDDYLIEEIDLDEPDDEPQFQAEVQQAPTLDEIEEVEEVDFDSLLQELELPDQQTESLSSETITADPSLTVADELVEAKPERPQFDSSELDEFAESLVDEDLSETSFISVDDDPDIDIDALLAEANSSGDEPELHSEPDQLIELPTEQDESDLQIVGLQFDEDDYPLSPDDVAFLLTEETGSSEQGSMPNNFHADHAELNALLDEATESELMDEELETQLLDETPESELMDKEPEAELLDEMPESELIDEEPETQLLNETPESELMDEKFETQLLDEALGSGLMDEELETQLLDEDPETVLIDEEPNEAWLELTDTAIESQLVEPIPDLDVVEDPSVSRVSAATLSVENPSKVLEEYPDLELLDDSQMDLDADDELLTSSETKPQSDGSDTAEDIAAELAALDVADFDDLLADYAQDNSELRQIDKNIADLVLNELEPADRSVLSEHQPEPISVGATEALTDTDDLELSLLELDKLLEDTQDESDSVLDPVYKIDVGLEDYQDFIAAQHEPELDPLEQAFAADLDLIRAYIEIGEQDGAEHLIDKVLSSTAPEHIKQEAQSLKDQL